MYCNGMLPLAFRFAQRASKKSDHPKYQLGAAIMVGKSVLGTGSNTIMKHHPISASINPQKTIHAEIAALIGCRYRKDLADAVVIVYREDKAGQPATARPCSVCREVLRQFGIKRMMYTTQNGFAMEEVL